MKVEGSHRSSLMLLWNSFAADFAFHFFLGSIYQYREEKKNGRIGKEVICSSKETGTQRAVTSCARSSLRSGACSAFGTFWLRGYAAPKRLVPASRYWPWVTNGIWIYFFHCFVVIHESNIELKTKERLFGALLAKSNDEGLMWNEFCGRSCPQPITGGYKLRSVLTALRAVLGLRHIGFREYAQANVL